MRVWISLIVLMTAGWSAESIADDFQSPIVEETIRIEADRLIYKKKAIPIPITRKSLIRTFGKPSREIYNAAGTIVIWDDIGLTCYGCQEQKGEPEEFQYLTKEEKKQLRPREYIDSIKLFVRKYNPYPEREKRYQHEPRLPFNGKILLDGVELDGQVRFDQFVENRKSNYTILLPDNTFSFFVRCKPAPHEITLHSIRDKYNEDYLSIFSVSIRNVQQYYKKVPCVDVFELEDTPEPVEDMKKYRLEQESPNTFDN